MNNVVPLIGNNSLASLVVDIRIHHEAVERAIESKLEHSIEAGKALIDAKAVIKPTGGSWLKWLALNFQFTTRTAENYMKLATNVDKIRNSDSNPNIRTALKLLATRDNVRLKPPRTISDSHKDAVSAANTGRIKAKRRSPNSKPVKQNFIPNIPGYLEEMLLTMERCVVEYEITPVEATAKAIIAHRIKVEHFDQIIDWLTQIKHMVHQTPSEESHGHQHKA